MTSISRRQVLALSGGAAAMTGAMTGAGTSARPAAAAAPGRPDPAPRPELARLSLEPVRNGDGSVGVRLRASGGGPALTQPLPLQILAKVGDAPVETSRGYAQLVREGAGFVGSGVVTTAAGSRYRFTDRWQLRGGAAVLDRTVTVLRAVATLEMGFNSRFALGPGTDRPLSEFDLILPGVRYGDTVGLGSGALAGDDAAEHAYVREMRLTLPYAALRQRSTGHTLAVAHVDADPRSDRDGYLDEHSSAWWISDAIRYASLGVHQEPRTELAVVYPAFEGDRTYLGGEWARRSHPVRTGFSHRYRLRITLATHDDLPTAAAATWRDQWDQLGPEPGRPAGTAVYAAALDLVAGLVEDYNGFPGLPFRCRLPSGDADAVSYAMGFIGQQAPAGYQLLRAGVRDHDRALEARGQSIIDFWVNESPLPSGLPRLWIDGDRPAWREWYPCFLRVASDGMDGVLDAARLRRRQGRPVAAWEAYLRAFGDFLVTHQDDDGSFPRAYNWDGTVNSDAKTNTAHPVRFLCGLSVLTGDRRYRDTAVRAGTFYDDLTAGTFHFVGGTADNPNVLDKEGGGMAMNAFLALHDATRDERWLDGAVRAADYTASWLVAWPWSVDTPRRAYRELGGLGLSLIATGHSGMDNWLTYQAANFYRLFLFTGDDHYRAIARILTSTGLRTTQYRGNDLGYARPGLIEEAVGLSDLTVAGTGVWLPWCSVAQLEPLATLADVFGSMDLDRIERLPLAERRRRNAAIGQQV